MNPFLLFTVCLVACSTSFAKKLVFVGDSLTAGYGVSQESAFPQIIKEKFLKDKSEWQIDASGSSGATTAALLKQLKWVSEDHPDVVFILMGSNDGLRGVKVDITEKNLSDAVTWAREHKMKVILGQLFVPPNYGKEYSKQFASVFPKIAKKFNIPLGPFLLDGVAGNPKLNQADGIHPNEKGHQIVAEKLYQYLKKELPKL
jgi:acyl-CoA thioesterase-1